MFQDVKVKRDDISTIQTLLVEMVEKVSKAEESQQFSVKDVEEIPEPAALGKASTDMVQDVSKLDETVEQSASTISLSNKGIGCHANYELHRCIIYENVAILIIYSISKCY